MKMSRVTTRWRYLLVPLVAVLLVGAAVIVPADAKPAPKTKGPIEVVVKVRWGSDPATVAADLDAVIVDTLIGSRRVVLLEVGDKDHKAAVKRLTADGRIVWAEANIVGSTPEDSHFHAWPSETWPRPGDDLLYQNQPAFSELGLGAIHDSTTGAGVLVAVLDTGVDASHEALAGRVKRRLDVIDGDFRPDDEGNGLDDDGDGHIDEAVGHGTHVAGAILLAAPDATILAYRVLDSDGKGTVFGVAEAIRHAVDSGADVINLSFGASKKFESVVLADALAHARANNVIVIAAAGNGSSDKKRYPAADASILAVAAYDASTGQLARFASHGKWVTVAAPGVDITSTVPDGRYATWSGSSMAAPFVSAEAALLLAIDPDLTVDQLTKLIAGSTRKLKGKRAAKDAVSITNAIAKVGA